MLKNLTPTIRELLPSLMGGAINLGDDELSGSETLRPLNAQSGTMSTFVIPATFPEDPRRWFPPVPTFPLREGNDVETYIDGEATYEAMVEAIETATGPDHFIVLLGWAAHFDFVLSKNGSRARGAKRTGAEVFEERAKLGVKLRFLLWNNGTLPEDAPWGDVDGDGIPYCKKTKRLADSWNQLEPDAVPRRSITILDNNTRSHGSHHQKILLVFGSQGLTAFVGGVDFNSDRVKKEPLLGGPFGMVVANPTGPLHDVHVRVCGEAAFDVLSLAVSRWNFAKPVLPVWAGTGPSYLDPGMIPPSGVLPAKGSEIEDLSWTSAAARGGSASTTTGGSIVQIAETIGNPDLEKRGRKSGVWTLIEHAIRESKRFIYVEDQYFWSRRAGHALLDAIDKLAHVTIVTCSDKELTSSLAPARHAMLKELLKRDSERSKRIQIYERVGLVHAYVHAKMSIFDDELAIVGSANWNDRGFTYDSEVVAGVADPEWTDRSGSRLGYWHALERDAASKLRMQLWSEHLAVDTDRISDPIAGQLLWRRLPPGAKVRPYQVNGVPWYDSREVLECDYEQGKGWDRLKDPEPKPPDPDD